MKRTVIIFMCTIILLVGCSANHAVNSNSDSLNIEATKTETSSSELNTTIPDTVSQHDNFVFTINTSNTNNMEETIKKLIDNNIFCFSEVFIIDTLSAYFPEGITEPKSYRVTSQKFKTFDDLSKFVKDTYCEKEADRLLYNFNDGPLYYQKDGIFYVDYSKHRDAGYYYDWSNYTFKYNDISDTEKKIKINVKYQDPGQDSPENVIFEEKIILEDGKWKLEEMFWK